MQGGLHRFLVRIAGFQALVDLMHNNHPPCIRSLVLRSRIVTFNLLSRFSVPLRLPCCALLQPVLSALCCKVNFLLAGLDK